MDRFARVEALLDQLRDEAAGVLETVRRLARELHPPELSDIGLEGAIRACARSFGESTGLEVHVRASDAAGDAERGLDQHARLTLYRAAQELLMDVVQRPDAGPVRLRLCSEPRAVALELEERGERGRRLTRGPSRPSNADNVSPVGGVGETEPRGPPSRARDDRWSRDCSRRSSTSATRS